jgi:hypothetical protein
LDEALPVEPSKMYCALTDTVTLLVKLVLANFGVSMTFVPEETLVAA